MRGGHTSISKSVKMTTASALVRTCQIFGLSMQDIKGKSRTKELCEARFAVIVALNHIGQGWSELGRTFNRDHSTIINGYNRGAYLCRHQYGFADIVEEILDAVSPGASEVLDGPWKEFSRNPTIRCAK